MIDNKINPLTLGTQNANVWVTQQGDCLSIRCKGVSPNPSSGGTRGVCKGFSPSSRKRLMKKLACLDKNLIGMPVFLTLTYGQTWPNIDVFKRDVKVFMQRVCRVDPSICGIWRVEFQKRGAPHLHLILFGCGSRKKWKISILDLRRMWGFTIDRAHWDYSKGPNPHFPNTRIDAIAGWRALSQYMCKYIAKLEDENEYFKPCDVNVDPQASADEVGTGGGSTGLGNVTYQTAESTTSAKSIAYGRVWGVIRGELLPVASKKHRVFEYHQEWYERLLDMCRFAWRRYPRNCQGFTIFSGDSEYWVSQIEQLGAKEL